MKQKKTRVITLRLTDQDYWDIFHEAEEYGMSISEFIREKAVPKYIYLDD